MKNRLIILAFVFVTAAVIVGFVGLNKYSDFKNENYLKPAMARNDIIKIMHAVLIYEQEQGSIPPSDSIELIQSYKPETEVIYPEFPITDPWGNKYMFKTPGPEGIPYCIISFGADGKKGGAGKDADLDSNAVFNKYKEELSSHTSNDPE